MSDDFDAGRDAPTCRECGGILYCPPGGALTCGNEHDAGPRDLASRLAECREERDAARAESAALREALEPLLTDYCELHDNPTKVEMFVEPAERALKPGAGSALLGRLRAAERVVEAARAYALRSGVHPDAQPEVHAARSALLVALEDYEGT